MCLCVSVYGGSQVFPDEDNDVIDMHACVHYVCKHTH